MAQRSDYAPGTPSWVDIGTDVEAAKPFYCGLFGWNATAAGPVEETGGYGIFMKGDQPVAGFGPAQNPGPPFWATYISVADVDTIAKKVEQAGGTVIVAPMDVMEAGRMAVFQDSQGGFVSAWQPGQMKGAQVVKEPGSLSWNELNTRDVEGSKAFYSAVFGWDTVTQTGGSMDYTECKVGGEPIAGMVEMAPNVPDQVPTFWLVYFAVDDTDAAVAKVTELGGSVSMPPVDIPQGRFAVVADPQGASFGVIKMAG
jgi:predicted enzyme related to lactoylglutathione lyase